MSNAYDLLEKKFDSIVRNEMRKSGDSDGVYVRLGLDGGTGSGPYSTKFTKLQSKASGTSIYIAERWFPRKKTAWLACEFVVELVTPQLRARLWLPMVQDSRGWQLRIVERQRRGLKTFSPALRQTFPRYFKTTLQNGRVKKSYFFRDPWFDWILHAFMREAGILSA